MRAHAHTFPQRRPEVDRLDGQLALFAATLDGLLRVQAGWLALVDVLAAPDIQRQLPAEAAAFAGVDRTFKDVLRRVAERPAALAAGTTPGWCEALARCAAALEGVQRGLEDYLEAKRSAFPRCVHALVAAVVLAAVVVVIFPALRCLG